MPANVGRVVQVTVPAGVAHDFEKMQKVTKTLLSQLGCAACHSGIDIRFTHESEFLVGNDLAVRPVQSPEQF